MEGINWKHWLKLALPWVGRLILSRVPVVGPALAAAATAGAAMIPEDAERAKGFDDTTSTIT